MPLEAILAGQAGREAILQGRYGSAAAQNKIYNSSTTCSM